MKIWNFIVYMLRVVLFPIARYKIHRYEDGKYFLMDRAKGISYESWSNTTKEFHSSYDGNVITKKKYLELLKNDICSCEFNTGNDIFSSKEPFNIIEEFVKSYPDYYIEKYYRYAYDEYYYYIFRNDCFDTYMVYRCSTIPEYRRRGCLRCSTCLSDLPKLHEKFDMWINELNEKIEAPREKKLKEICNH